MVHKLIKYRRFEKNRLQIYENQNAQGRVIVDFVKDANTKYLVDDKTNGIIIVSPYDIIGVDDGKL